MQVFHVKHSGEDSALNSTAQVEQSLLGAQILLVEDNKINQQVAMELLESSGINVSIANN